VSAKAHPRLIGAFVLGAIGLVLGTVVALSAGNWLARRDRFALYFPGSVKGLDKGAPVTFRGVKVGEVQDVQAILTGRPAALIQIEVVVDVRHDVVEVPPGQSVPADLLPSTSRQQFARGLIGREIRARLKSASLLTGQKYIDLDFQPEEPARFAGLSPRYPELPTTPTAMEKLGDRVEGILDKAADLPVDQMLDDLRKTLGAAREVLESSDLRGAFAGANRSTRKMESTLVQVEATFRTAAETLVALRGETGPTAEEARRTLRAFHKTADQAQAGLIDVKETLSGADDMRLTANHALEELIHTLQAFRNLAEYLQTHPEAIVIGKAKSASGAATEKEKMR
jgi:paraquat-inducible protein B